MEPSGLMHSMSSFKNLRRGQREVVEKFKEMICDDCGAVNAKLPTGYGKSKTAVGSFALLKNAGKVDNMLFVVPRTAQASQAAEAIPEELLEFGIDTLSYDFGDSPNRAHDALRDGKSCVFVITIQAMISPQTRDSLKKAMCSGRWMIVADEYHHYKVEGKWTEWLKSLPYSYFLAMSATPDREDCPSPFGKPEISITYREAVAEFAVKPLTLHSYDYKITGVNKDGEIISFAISDLQSEMSEDRSIESIVASRGVRWLPDYISPLVSEPIKRINALAMYGIFSQIIIKALDCSHAKFVCEQVRQLLDDGMTVDWVGTGPNGREFEPDGKTNKEILNLFCPPKKNGRRDWKLNVLVSVGMAGEGLDTQDATEAVFITNPRGSISDRQFIGRIARTMNVNEVYKDEIIGHINVDSGCDLSKFLGSKIMDVFDTNCEYMDDEDISNDDDNGNAETEPKELTDDIDWINIFLPLTAELIDIKHDPEYVPLRNRLIDGLSGRFPESDIDRAADKILQAYLTEKMNSTKSKNQTANDESSRKQVLAIYKTVTQKLHKFISFKYNCPIDNDLKVYVNKRVNSQKAKVCGSIENCSGDDFQKHIDFLKSIDESIMLGEVPSWLV